MQAKAQGIKGYQQNRAFVVSEDGNEHVERLRDYVAIVVQHEIDHLNGVLFFDHINKENPFVVSDIWVKDDILHIDVSYLVNKATVEYVNDMNTLEQNNVKLSSIATSVKF